MNRLVNGQINWYLFNIYGLEIDDQENWRDFIFDNVTIVNSKQFIDYLDEINYDENAVFRDILKGIPSNHTFLIVQTFGKLTKVNENGNNKQAEKRALEVAGFIYFVFLFLSDFRKGISLDSQLYNSSGSEIHIFTSYKLTSMIQKHTSNEYHITLPTENFKYSGDNLEKIFNKKQFFNLYEIVKSRNNNTILESVSTFYLTSNIPSPTSQLLGAITSIEILLKDDWGASHFLERHSTLSCHSNIEVTGSENFKRIFTE
ncbi:MAG: hypothetical protein HW421_877 [Ignavibacteria bacterium]|nr:hypothetical protein [Ignavibacteria bacterium]